MIHEHATVVLREDLPEHNLRAGDLGVVVMVHREGACYEVEFLTLSGETLAVVTLSPQQIRLVGRREIAHAREVHCP